MPCLGPISCQASRFGFVEDTDSFIGDGNLGVVECILELFIPMEFDRLEQDTQWEHLVCHAECVET